MGDGSTTPRLSCMKALLGIVAGAGASYGIYKLMSGGSYKKSKNGESVDVRRSQSCEVTMQPGSLLAKLSGLDVVSGRGADTHDASGKNRGAKQSIAEQLTITYT